VAAAAGGSVARRRRWRGSASGRARKWRWRARPPQYRRASQGERGSDDLPSGSDGELPCWEELRQAADLPGTSTRGRIDGARFYFAIFMQKNSFQCLEIFSKVFLKKLRPTFLSDFLINFCVKVFEKSLCLQFFLQTFSKNLFTNFFILFQTF
jgi:hypothetical protein